MIMLTLANCNIHQLEKVARRLHPARSRRELIFAAGTLNNKNLQKGLGSQETSTFYDGLVAAGLLDKNPYWPEYGERKQD
jgi:hypothetical protein